MYSIPLSVLNIILSKSPVNIYTKVLDIKPNKNENIIDCFNLFLINLLLFLFLDISGIRDVLSANIKNDGIVSKGKTYAL